MVGEAQKFVGGASCQCLQGQEALSCGQERGWACASSCSGTWRLAPCPGKVTKTSSMRGQCSATCWFLFVGGLRRRKAPLKNVSGGDHSEEKAACGMSLTPENTTHQQFGQPPSIQWTNPAASCPAPKKQTSLMLWRHFFERVVATRQRSSQRAAKRPALGVAPLLVLCQPLACGERRQGSRGRTVHLQHKPLFQGTSVVNSKAGNSTCFLEPVPAELCPAACCSPSPVVGPLQTAAHTSIARPQPSPPGGWR